MHCLQVRRTRHNTATHKSKARAAAQRQKKSKIYAGKPHET